MIDAALAHFAKVDPRMHELVLIHRDTTREPEVIAPDLYFERLCRTIVGQQLSVKAAATIWQRTLASLGTDTSKPLATEDFSRVDDDSLRAAGLSYQKIGYIRALIESLDNRAVDLTSLGKMDDNRVIAELTKLKGIGTWSAEMFLIFAMGRPDVFSAGDLGLMTAAAQLYQLDRKADADKIVANLERLSPYRTVASLTLWHSLDNQPK